MPEMDGLEATRGHPCARVARQRAVPDHRDDGAARWPATASDASTPGWMGYTSKPIDVRELRKAIAALI